MINQLEELIIGHWKRIYSNLSKNNFYYVEVPFKKLLISSLEIYLILKAFFYISNFKFRKYFASTIFY